MSEHRHDDLFKKGLEELSPSDFPYDPSAWDQLSEQMDNQGVLLPPASQTDVKTAVWRWLTTLFALALLLFGSWQWYDLSATVREQADALADYQSQLADVRQDLQAERIRRKASQSLQATQRDSLAALGRIIDTIVVERRIYVTTTAGDASVAPSEGASPAFRRIADPASPTGERSRDAATALPRQGEPPLQNTAAGPSAIDTLTAESAAPTTPTTPTTPSDRMKADSLQAQPFRDEAAKEPQGVDSLAQLTSLPMAAVLATQAASLGVDTTAAAAPRKRTFVQRVADQTRYQVGQGRWSVELLGTHPLAHYGTRYTRNEWSTGLGVARGVGEAWSIGAQVQWRYDDNYLDGINGLTDLNDNYFEAYPNLENNKNNPADALNRVEGKLQSATAALVVGYEPWSSRTLHPLLQVGAQWRMDIRQELEYYYLRSPNYGSLYEVHESANVRRLAWSGWQVQGGLVWEVAPDWALRMSAMYEHSRTSDTWEPVRIHRLGAQLGVQYTW